MKIKLSISVLVSDSVESADKCLKSLKPILKEVPSELLVVYTGTNPLSLKIARKYTDQIIPFVWCDDFSKARNIGLKRAVGEWFMYIDDDEWFENCNEIVRFFNSGEYKKYNSASYQVRNYSDMNGLEYADAAVGRMIRRTAKTEFTGMVHEHLIPWTSPVKYFECFVHHYGYVPGNADKKMDSSERNIPILLRQLEKQPGETLSRIQLIQEYSRIQRFNDAEKECRYVLSCIGPEDTNHYFEWAALYLVKTLLKKNLMKEALEEGGAFLSSFSFSGLYGMNLCIFLVPICLKLKKYAEGISCARSYISLRDHMENHPELWDEQQMLTINRKNTVNKNYIIYTQALMCATCLLDFEAAGFFLKECLCDEKSFCGHMCQSLEIWYHTFPQCEKEILMLYSEMDSENPYVLFQKALYCEKEGEIQKAEELYRRCQSENGQPFLHQIILMALRNGFALPESIKTMDLEEWKSCAQQIASVYERDVYLCGRDCFERLFSVYPLHKAILQQKITARLLYDKESDHHTFLELLTEYCKTVLELNHFLYRDEVFEADMQFALPKDCRAALEIQCVLTVIHNADQAKISKSLKALMNAYPNLSHIARRLIDIASQFNGERASEKSYSEFLEEGQKVKAVLRQLAGQERYAEALEVAERLGALLPWDLEVARYKQQLHLMITGQS